jgi:hypothetical protein
LLTTKETRKKQNMKETLQNSQRVSARVTEYEDADIIDLVNKGKVGLITPCVNADRRQKVALVDFRSDLLDKIVALGFVRETETEMKDGQAVEVPKNTEGQDVRKFTDALVAGTFCPNGFTLVGHDEDAKEACALAYLQSLASQLGPYVLDVNRPERQPGTGLLPKWAKDGAANIIANKNQQAWVEKLTNGFTSPEGIAIDPIPFQSFVDKADKSASPEEKQAMLERNVKHLAAALVAYDKQKRAKTASEFA